MAARKPLRRSRARGSQAMKEALNRRAAQNRTDRCAASRHVAHGDSFERETWAVRRPLSLLLVLVFALGLSGRAEAHATSTSYLVAETRAGEPAESADVDVFWGLSVAQA